MVKHFFTLLFLSMCIGLRAQENSIPIPGSINLSKDLPLNGTLDEITDFAQRIEVPFRMPDGTLLRTDVYLPIFQDSMAFEFQIPIINQNTKLVVIPRGTQYIRYDSLNGQPNPNPLQLPVVLSRTPYNKKGPEMGTAMALLGYAGMVQDLRGRYRSEGVHFPLYSDGWSKVPYHPGYSHIMDITSLNDPRNANKHEDGYNTIEFIKDSLVRDFDLNHDGVPETQELLYNGSIGMFGASALGYNQLQAAAAHKIDPTKPGLKGLIPIVGPLEFYKSTGYHNGVFRQSLVTGWVGGEIADLDDSKRDIDDGIMNNIHTSLDYGQPTVMDAVNLAIDHFCSVKYLNGAPAYYPYSKGRYDLDASRAMVDENGEGDINGTKSRYTNMEVPTYHVGGWWDIFVDGTIETFNYQRSHMSSQYGNRDLIKCLIGPWAHPTITARETGDMIYPENVTDITKFDLSGLENGNINIGEIASSELISWFRYTVNQNPVNNVGEPTIVLPESQVFQKIIDGIEVRFPAAEYTMNHAQLVNFMGGADGLKNVPVEWRILGIKSKKKINIPKIPPLIEGFSSTKMDPIHATDFTKIAPMRFYVVGPSPELDPANTGIGNYWFESDSFPLTNNITWRSLYLRGGGKLSTEAPTSDEGFGVYVSDPDNPVLTVGGGNMLVKTPQGDRDSQGQMKVSDPLFAPYTMDRDDVLQFVSDTLIDSMSFIGFPKAKIYAKSNPEGAVNGDPTSCDFVVRIIDVYPNGDEYFVQSAVVNARAREWAKDYAEGHENDHAVYSNIESGKIYEYYFNFLPIAYTFGKGHKIKVLVSSSEYPRYQSNPNLPLNEDEFFRRKPNDGKTYVFNGVEMAPRKATQSIAFSSEYPSQIILPVYGESLITAVKNHISKVNWDAQIYPNPSNGVMNIYPTKSGKYTLSVFNTTGQHILSKEFDNQINLDMSKQAKGQYFIEIQEKDAPSNRLTKSISIL